MFVYQLHGKKIKIKKLPWAVYVLKQDLKQAFGLFAEKTIRKKKVFKCLITTLFLSLASPDNSLKKQTNKQTKRTKAKKQKRKKQIKATKTNRSTLCNQIIKQYLLSKWDTFSRNVSWIYNYGYVSHVSWLAESCS